MQAVQRLLCSEVSSAELREACLAAWAALEPLPPPERSRGRGNTYLLLGPHKCVRVRVIVCVARTACTHVRCTRHTLHPRVCLGVCLL